MFSFEALRNATNITKDGSCPSLTTQKRTRPSLVDDNTDNTERKRIKILHAASSPLDDSDNEYSASVPEVPLRIRGRACTNAFNILNSSSRARPGCRPVELSTRSILQSFVSSRKHDNYKCLSNDEDQYLTTPYKCAYTHAAKRGGEPLLAVATEEGSVQIFNTSKRKEWDVPTSPKTVQAHEANGVFDVKWSPEDDLLATVSGDRSGSISCPTTSTVLYHLQGHNGTVRSVTWSNRNICATGGRDGSICVWDFRAGETRDSDEGRRVLTPVMTLFGAHQEEGQPKVPRRNARNKPAAKSVTGLMYTSETNLVSSGSFNGVLRGWDIRFPSGKKKAKPPQDPSSITLIDPTMLHGSRRPRGLISVAEGAGPTADVIFGLSADSRIHAYDASTLDAHLNEGYTHRNMQSHSFYVHLAVSPCGRWLASGSAGNDGRIFLYDVSNTGKTSRHGMPLSEGVELKGSVGEMGAVDWADGMLATCSNDGSVSIWRPDVHRYKQCVEDPEDSQWGWHWSARV